LPLIFSVIITFFQLTEEAERNVNKSRALLDDIVRENKGISVLILSECLSMIIVFRISFQDFKRVEGFRASRQVRKFGFLNCIALGLPERMIDSFCPSTKNRKSQGWSGFQNEMKKYRNCMASETPIPPTELTLPPFHPRSILKPVFVSRDPKLMACMSLPLRTWQHLTFFLFCLIVFSV